MNKKSNKGFSKKTRNILKDVNIADIYKGFKDNLDLAGIVYLDKNRKCISEQFEVSGTLKPLTVDDLITLTQTQEHVNIVQVVVEGKKIISSDVIVDIKMQPKRLAPAPVKIIDTSVKFTQDQPIDTAKIRESAEEFAKVTLERINKTLH